MKDTEILKGIKKELVELNKTMSSIRTFIIANAQISKKHMMESQKTNSYFKKIIELKEKELEENNGKH